MSPPYTPKYVNKWNSRKKPTKRFQLIILNNTLVTGSVQEVQEKADNNILGTTYILKGIF